MILKLQNRKKLEMECLYFSQSNLRWAGSMIKALRNKQPKKDPEHPPNL